MDLQNIKKLTSLEICQMVREKADKLGLFDEECISEDSEFVNNINGSGEDDFACFIPYNLVTQHSIPGQ